MGRKIPGKKHRTVKDPYKQNQIRLNKIKNKVNNPPSNVNEQEVPKSLIKIMELKNAVKNTENRKFRRRKKQVTTALSVSKLLDKEPYQKGFTKPDRYIPNLVQKPNESAKSFLRRVTSMTQNLINEVEFEKKFGVEIQKNPNTGQVLEVKKVKKEKKSKKSKLADKRKEKLNQKKENLKNIKDFSQLKDDVKFGEVVHRPPDLEKVKKKKNEQWKPKFSSLVLSSTINGTSDESKILQGNFEKEKQERERKFIVEAYRKIRKRNID